MKQKFLALICGILLSACTPAWTLVNNDNNQLQLSEISLALPEGWVQYNLHYDNYTAMKNGSRVETKVRRLVVTRNGLNLDFIDVIEFSIDQAFPGVERAADPDKLPSELAELFIAEQKNILGIDQVQVAKNEPAVVAGRAGYVVELRFKNRTGLELEQRSYGFATQRSFYTFTFRAPALHYFPSGASQFEALIASVSLRS